MPAAATAMDGGARHEVGAVAGRPDRVVERLPEAGPAGVAVVFGRRRVERQRAACAIIGTVTALEIERARERRLGRALAQYLVLLGREQLAPLGIAVGDL